jgi:signal transduction histidine kinase
VRAIPLLLGLCALVLGVALTQATVRAAARRSDGPRRGGGTERPDRPQARRGGTRRTDGYHDASEATEAGGLDEEFLGAVAHELRSPLGLIKDYAATLLAPDAPRDEGTVRRCLSVVVEASQRLEGLLEQLLDPSRIRAGALALQPRPVRLGPLAQTALERAALRAARHRLRLGVPAGLPPVLADAPRLEQVLDNLLDNALKYSPDGGEVVVSAGSAGAEVVVSVSDQGLGVPAEELGQLFGRFYRGAVARARAIRGDGLGLAICRGIVEAHGGRIWAESPAPGRPPGAGPGTTVSFTLPAAVAPAGVRGARPPCSDAVGSPDEP